MLGHLNPFRSSCKRLMAIGFLWPAYNLLCEASSGHLIIGLLLAFQASYARMLSTNPLCSLSLKAWPEVFWKALAILPCKPLICLCCLHLINLLDHLIQKPLWLCRSRRTFYDIILLRPSYKPPRPSHRPLIRLLRSVWHPRPISWPKRPITWQYEV